jgi:hypothetical protein
MAGLEMGVARHCGSSISINHCAFELEERRERHVGVKESMGREFMSNCGDFA